MRNDWHVDGKTHFIDVQNIQELDTVLHSTTILSRAAVSATRLARPDAKSGVKCTHI
jgi:hypothetical protein